MAIYAGMNSQVACGSIGGRHHHHRCYRQQQNVSTSCSNGSERRNKQQQFLRCGVSGQNPLDSDQKRSRNRRNTNRITRCKSGESNNNDVTEDTGRFQSSSTRTSTTRVLLQSLLRMMPSPRDSSSQNVYNNSVPRETGDESTSVKTASPEQEELISGIAAFYDESSSLWESMWGEHMHHGYYDENDENVSEYSLDDHRKAQVLMIDKVLDWAKIDDDLNKPSGGQLQLLDVGCGIGGSSRHMVQRFSDSGNEWKGFGVTLSPNQAQRANSITRDCFASPVPLTYLVRDAVNLNTVVDANVEQSLASPSKITFEDNSFDLIWSMESAEHMKDKRALMKEMHRVCKPGGKIILVTWCHRSTEAEVCCALRSEFCVHTLKVVRHIDCDHTHFDLH